MAAQVQQHTLEDPIDSPGAGPSRQIQAEEHSRQEYAKRRKDYLELERNIQASDELLSSLASYLSSFQNDLSTVSGQVSDLQQRSDEIEAQLRGRRTILPPLNALLSDITLPLSLVLTIRDTQPSQNPDLWLSAISDLDTKIQICASRPKVLAAQQMESIISGLTARALAQLPPFLLSLIRPLRSASKGLSTNLAVLQTSLLLKYQPFFAFLRNHSPRTAKQVERGYVNAARSYYETALRRYTRALGIIKARTATGTATMSASENDSANLRYATIEEESEVVLLYQADDKDYRQPIESLFRSLSLVLLDNASAEFTFLVRFFGSPAQAAATGTSVPSTPSASASPPRAEPDLKDAERLFHEVLDPAVESCEAFFQSLLLPSPSAISLLILIRLNDAVLDLAEARGTAPLIPFLQKQRLALWPMYRKDIDKRIDEIKRLVSEAESKGLAGFMGKGVKDAAVRQMAVRYAGLFSCTVVLSQEADDMMVFSSLVRLRNELVKLINAQAAKLKTANDRQGFLSTMFEVVMHELVSGPGATTHPKLQSELSFFRTREEEARRRIAT